MKTLNLQSATALFLTILMNLTILANGLEFRLKTTVSITDSNISKSSEFMPIRNAPEFTELGSCSDYIIAMKLQNKIETLGVCHSEIVAYFNHTQISLDDAFAILDNRNAQELASIDQPYMSEEDMEIALKRVQNEYFYYTIQIGIFDETNVNSFFDFPKTIDETITSKGYYRYTFGKFYTMNDAKDALNMMRENNFQNAEIIAFDNLERIPLASAVQKEERRLQQSLAYFQD